MGKMKKLLCILTAAVLSVSLSAMPAAAAKKNKDSGKSETTAVTEVTEKEKKEKTTTAKKNKDEEKAETSKKDKDEEKKKEKDSSKGGDETEASKKGGNKEEQTATTTAKKEDKNKVFVPKSTLCFDTDKSVTDGILKPFGSYERTSLKMETDMIVFMSNASLAISQDFAGELDSSEQNTGFYIDAESLGLDTFSGTEISLYVYAQDVGADRLCLFTDGDIVLYSDNITMTKSPRWEKVTITVPEDVNNTKFGLLISSQKGYTGTVCYIDDLVVKNRDGVKIRNIGDFKEFTEANKISPLGIALFVLLILGVGAAAVFFTHKLKNRYR